MDDLPQSLRNSRYAVVRLLGEGGQGSTFEAVDKSQGKLVAIKRFRVRGAKSWKEVELAEREANVLSSISHPSLPRYIEHFEEGGQLFLVTEKIEGESLSELKKGGRTLGEAEVIRFLREASLALEYLHGRAPPVIHRDIKPSNVIRRPDGSFALIDFGSVRDRMKPEGGSTVVGTFGYMAPEQFQGRAMPASDVYAVGATALTLLTGVEPEDLPHRGLAVDVKAALRGGQASPELTQAIAAMLEPDPDRRARRLGPLLEGLGRRQAKEPSAARKSRPAPEERKASAGWKQSREKWDRKREREEVREESRHVRRQMKREIKTLARQTRRLERGWRDAALPGVVLIFVLLGLSIAQVAVLVALRVIVPTVIMILSVFFGKGMRPAAAGVANAGKTAGEALRRAKDFVRGRPVAADPARVRVDPGIRVTVPGASAEQEAEAELAAEEEAAFEQEARKPGKKS